MEELRECPFCGSEMRKFHWPDYNRPWRSFDYWTCKKIGCLTGELKIEVGDIDTFNTRASDAAIKELVDELETMVRVAEFHGWGESADGRRVPLKGARETVSKHKQQA